MSAQILPFTAPAANRPVPLDAQRAAQDLLEAQIDRLAQSLTDRARRDQTLAEAAELATRASARVRRRRALSALVWACAIASAALPFALLHDTPARTAATVLQAEQMKGW